MDTTAAIEQQIKNPPTNIWQRFKHLGPSLILTANIVGSGELIMTTTLGARAGFVTLWVILLSCLLKVTIQLEFGKHAISSGETSMEAFNKLPGWRWRGTSWSIWIWLAVKILQMIQYGGIVGGVALVLNMAFPSIPIWIWALLACLSTTLLVFEGKYQQIERISIFLIAAFSLFTIYCVLALQFTPYKISIAHISEGLSFRLPAASLGIALAAYGITGVSADEIISYPYWCLEKGYAKFTGSHSEQKEWKPRAKAWIKVMYLDGILSMIIYTLSTAAFYLLGAAILHKQNMIPAGYDLIKTLSNIYTEAIGPGAKYIFMVGAFVTLYSTLFVACASGTRMFTDAFAQLNLLDYNNFSQRSKWFKYLAIILPLSWAILFLSIKAPLMMVMIGGISLSILLAMVVYAAYFFRYNRLPSELKPGLVYDLFLWLSILSIAGVGIYSIFNILS